MMIYQVGFRIDRGEWILILARPGMMVHIHGATVLLKIGLLIWNWYTVAYDI